MEIDDSFEIPNEILKELGYHSVEELFKAVLPEDIIYKGKIDIPRIDEKNLKNYILSRIKGDKVFRLDKVYVGGGVWPIYVPYIINYIISRSEFLTSYTPYQAEISQGTMQALYEYQSLMAELLDLDVVNSSMYDWASAAGEALLMSIRVKKKKNHVLLSPHIPSNREIVIKTYLWGSNIKYDYLLIDEEGDIDLKILKKKLSEGVSGVYIEYPNMFGYIYENLDEAINLIHEFNALAIIGVDPLTLPILKPPGELGADIVVGEGQPLGLHMSFGGPLLGIFAVRGEISLIRNMPGRIIGLTHDTDGEKAFTMILQTREQHIRREKATSNICTNEALSAISSAIYISLLGKSGLLNLSRRLIINAHILLDKLIELGFRIKYNKPFFREFALQENEPYKTDTLIKEMVERGYLFGYVDKDAHILSINEYHTPEGFDELINDLGDLKHE